MSIMKIGIVSSSVRNGRLSHRVALFLKEYIARVTGAETYVLDLKEYDFPLFHERLAYLEQPPEALLDYAERFKAADGIVVVSPVYNGSFPAALKNAIDVLFPEWQHKPALVVSVTYGSTPGIATVQSLQAMLLKMGARVTGPLYTVVNAGEEYAEDGTPATPEKAEKNAARPIEELMWMVGKNME